MARHPVDRSQRDGAVKAEIFVGPVARRGAQRWRWDVTFQRIATHNHAQLGVDGRSHIGGECGYALTQAGAWRAARRAFHAYPEPVV